MLFKSSKKKTQQPQAQGQAQPAMVQAEVVEAYAVEPAAQTPTVVSVEGTALAQGEMSRCRSCGISFQRNPAYHDCDARYYRCARCNPTKHSFEVGALLDCVIV